MRFARRMNRGAALSAQVDASLVLWRSAKGLQVTVLQDALTKNLQHDPERGLRPPHHCCQAMAASWAPIG